MKFKRTQSGISVISMLLVTAAVSVALFKTISYFNDAQYSYESHENALDLIELARKISSATEIDGDCSKVDKSFVVNNNLIPKSWRVDKSNPIDPIIYWGKDDLSKAVINTDLDSRFIPPGGLIDGYDLFSIKLRNYKTDDVPGVITNLVNNFDYVVYSGYFIKDMNGFHADVLNEALKNAANRSGLLVAKMGC